MKPTTDQEKENWVLQSVIHSSLRRRPHAEQAYSRETPDWHKAEGKIRTVGKCLYCGFHGETSLGWATLDNFSMLWGIEAVLGYLVSSLGTVRADV